MVAGSVVEACLLSEIVLFRVTGAMAMVVGSTTPVLLPSVVAPFLVTKAVERVVASIITQAVRPRLTQAQSLGTQAWTMGVVFSIIKVASSTYSKTQSLGTLR